MLGIDYGREPSWTSVAIAIPALAQPNSPPSLLIDRSHERAIAQQLPVDSPVGSQIDLYDVAYLYAQRLLAVSLLAGALAIAIGGLPLQPQRNLVSD